MAIAMTLQQYLDDRHVTYDVTEHRKTGCSTKTAQASHVPGDNLAKGVVLKWDDSYILAVVPATRHVEIEKVTDIVEGPVVLASEPEVARLFPDCEQGAVPVMGEAYGLPTIVDERLDDCDDIYFEGGDHRSLVHITGDHFSHLMSDMTHSLIST